MLYRVFGFAFVALALGMFLSASGAVAGDKTSTHEGKVVSVKGQTLTMEGKNGKEHKHDVTLNAKITCDGKDCKLADLKSGQRIIVTTDDSNRATRIQAFLKTEPKRQQ